MLHAVVLLVVYACTVVRHKRIISTYCILYSERIVDKYKIVPYNIIIIGTCRSLDKWGF